jgi:hypothetical protein
LKAALGERAAFKGRIPALFQARSPPQFRRGGQEWGFAVWAHNQYDKEFHQALNDFEQGVPANRAKAFLSQFQGFDNTAEAAVAMYRNLARKVERSPGGMNTTKELQILEVIRTGLRGHNGQHNNLTIADVQLLLEAGQPSMPTPLPLPTRPADAEIRLLRYQTKSSKLVTDADYQAYVEQVLGQVAAFDRTLISQDPQTGGMEGLQRAIQYNRDNWREIEQRGHQYSSQLRDRHNTPPELTWLHEQDMGAGGHPINSVRRTGHTDANIAVGGAANGIADRIMRFEATVTWFEPEIIIHGRRVEFQR